MSKFGLMCVAARKDAILRALKEVDYTVFEGDEKLFSLYRDEDAEYIIECMTKARGQYAIIDLEVGLKAIMNSTMQERGTVILTDADIWEV